MLSKIKNEYLVFFISFLIYFPIILWGGYFLDDNYRSVHAYYAWTGDYRPIADWIYYILGFGTDFVDTFPLNYIIQFLFVSYFILFFTKNIQVKFLLNENLKNYISLSISLLFISPFFMQNLYFRYDSLIMVLSIIFACMPFFFNDKKIDLIFCIMVLFTYQSSIVGYMCVVILRLLVMSQNNEEKLIIYKEVGKSILVFIASIIIFFLCAKLFITPNSYAENHTSFVTSFKMFSENITYSLDILSFSNSTLDYALVFFSLIIALLFLFRIISCNSKINNFDIFLICTGVIFVFTICILNMNIFLLKPRLYSRTYIGVGFALLLIGLSLTFLITFKEQAFRKYVYFYKFLFLSIYLMCLNIFYIGYNYIKETEKYSENLINNISYDLSTLGKRQYKSIVAYGEPLKTLRSNNLIHRYPILLNNFYDSNTISHHKFRIFYDLLLNKGFLFKRIGYSGTPISKEYNKYINSKPTIKRSEYNIIITNNDELFIYLKKEDIPKKSPLARSRLD